MLWSVAGSVYCVVVSMASAWGSGVVCMIPRPMEFFYNQCMSSREWKVLRNRVIEKTYNHDRCRSNGYEDNVYECQRCGWNHRRTEIEVHHLTYENLGSEKENDLIVVCKRCHNILDRMRAAASRNKSRMSLFEAQKHGWARKKYGENYYEYKDPYDVHCEFLEWVEDKQDEC